MVWGKAIDKTLSVQVLKQVGCLPDLLRLLSKHKQQSAMPITFSPAALQDAIAAQPSNRQPAQTRYVSAAKPSLVQLIDAREVIRLLAFHLLQSSLTREIEQMRYVKAALAHIHHGGLLTNTGTRAASGVIQPCSVGSGVFVRSLWLFSSRDLQGQYWRANLIYGYKPDPFPHFKESMLVLLALREFVLSRGQQPVAVPSLEFVDLAQEILSEGLIEPASRVLLLSSNKQALQCVRDSPVQVAKVSLRENAGQRVMGVRDAFGWLAGKLENASPSKQALFLDMSMGEFLAHPCKFLGRFDYLERVGIRQYKAQAAAEGGIPSELLSVCEGSRSEHYPKDAEDSLSKISNYLENFKNLERGQLGALEKYLIGTGQGLPIAKVKLPVRLGVFNV